MGWRSKVSSRYLCVIPDNYRRGGLPGEAHSQQGESVMVNEVHTVLLAVLWMGVGGLPKIRQSFVDQLANVIHVMLVFLHESLGFHPVELCDVSLLELGGSRPGESHSQEGEPITGHQVHGGHALDGTSLNLNFRQRKIAPTKIFRAIKVLNGLEYILVHLPENLGHLEGGGHG